MRPAVLCFAVLALVPVSSAHASWRVIDGDTFEWGGERVRLANIDAPELRGGKCDAERRLARVAARRLSELLAGGVFTVVPGDPADGRRRDRHGRLLAVVERDGTDLGAVLVAEGLARPWSGRREPWCS